MKLDALETDADRLRQRRAVEGLERIGTAEARRVLTAAAGGVDSTLTAEAKAALARLQKRGR